MRECIFVAAGSARRFVIPWEARLQAGAWVHHQHQRLKVLSNADLGLFTSALRPWHAAAPERRK